MKLRSRTVSTSLWLGLLAVGALMGGGPLRLQAPGVPYRWGGDPPRLVFHPDAGSLGPLDAETALSNLLAAAAAWEEIDSSSIEVRSGGPVRSVIGPEGRGDFAVSNVVPFLGVNNGGITPVIFDSEDENQNGVGDILEALGFGPGLLGIATPEFVDGNTIIEGFVMFNGLEVDPDDSSGENFRGTMTHELGHLLNLAHSVVNGQAYFFGGSDARTPDGLPIQPGAGDLETMYPFARPDVGGTGIGQSTPNLDDIAILSTIYPDSGRPLAAYGSLHGTVRSGTGQPRSGAQVIARNQDADPIQDAVSAISGDFVQSLNPFSLRHGTFELNRLTPGGRYSLEVRDTRGGGFSTPVFVSPDAFLNSPLGTLPGPEEYYSGPTESGSNQIDDPGAPPFLVDVGTPGPAGGQPTDIIFNSFQAPTNDACSAALEFSDSDLPFSDWQQTRGATNQVNEPVTTCGTGPETQSVWYTFTPAVSREILLSTAGSEYVTVIQVYSGACGSFIPVFRGCSDRGSLRLTVQAGTQYLIKVADLGTESGGGILNFSASLPPPAPANDACQQAIEFDLNQLPFADMLDTTSAGVTAGEPDFSCSFAGPGFNTVWYKFTNSGSESRKLDISTEGSNFDTIVEVFRGDCQNLQSVSCDDDGGEDLTSVATLSASPGETYFINVGGFSGPGDLKLTVAPGPVPPANDNCSGAIEVRRRDLPFFERLDTRAAGNAPDEPATTCGSESSPFQSASIWYRLVNDSILPLDLHISTAGSNRLTVLQTYGGSCGQPSARACGTLNGPLFDAELELSMEPGEELLLKLAGLGNLGGGNLNLLIEPATPSELNVTDLILNARSSPLTPTARGQIDYSLTVQNISDSPATDVTLNAVPDPALELRGVTPSQGNCDLTGGTLQCALGTLQPGDEPLIRLQASPREAGTRSLTAEIDWGANPLPATASGLTILSRTEPFLVFPARLDPAPPFPGAGPAGLLGRTFVGLALANVNPEETRFGLEGTDGEGFNTFILEDFGLLGSGAQEAFTSGQIPALTGDTTTVIARGNEFPLRGFFMAGDLNLRRLDGIGGTIVSSPTLLYPVIPPSSESTTLLKLFNPNREEAENVTLQLWDGQGQTVTQRALALPAGGSLEGELSVLLELATFDSGYLTVEADLALQGWVFLVHPEHVSSMLATPLAATTRLSSPHYFVDNNGGDSILTLVSRDPSIVDFEVSLFDHDGVHIGQKSLQIFPGQQLQFSVRELFDLVPPAGGTVTGSLSVVLEPQGNLGFFLPRAQVSGSITYLSNQGRVQSILPLLRAARTRTAFYQIAQSPETGLFTGLAILSSQDPDFDLDTEVTIRAFNPGGEMTATREIVIPAGRRTLGLLNEAVYFGPDFKQNGGRLEVIANRRVYAFSLFGDYAGQFLAAIEGQPN